MTEWDVKYHDIKGPLHYLAEIEQLRAEIERLQIAIHEGAATANVSRETTMKTKTEKQIIDLLERKQEINQFTDNHRWLLEATELLLRHQLELVEELRNAGILR